MNDLGIILSVLTSITKDLPIAIPEDAEIPFKTSIVINISVANFPVNK